MEIAGYIKTSLIEWPGKISSVIFVPGCNFRCPFCHNADLVLRERFTQIAEKRILADLEKRKGWIDAVVVTGGEPTLQKDLIKFLRILKKLKLLTMVHTNGTNPGLIEKLINEKLVDYWGMDLKGDLDNYGKYTGIQSSKFKVQNYSSELKISSDLIINSGIEYEFRTTVVPKLHDRKNLLLLANQLKEILNTKYLIQNTRWYLQQFRPMNCLDKDYLKVEPFSKEEMETILRSVKEMVPETYLRGV